MRREVSREAVLVTAESKSRSRDVVRRGELSMFRLVQATSAVGISASSSAATLTVYFYWTEFPGRQLAISELMELSTYYQASSFSS